jgi:hypothetical protein
MKGLFSYVFNVIVCVMFQVIEGNSNTYLGSKRELDPPVWASRIRYLPYSYHRRTVCMRVEVYGCYWNGKSQHSHACFHLASENIRARVRISAETTTIMKNGVFWHVTSRGSCKNRRFGGTQHLHQGDKNR